MMMPSLSYKAGEAEIAHDQREKQDPHLRSCDAVSGYHLHASDGEIGHVGGYLIDEKSWAVPSSSWTRPIGGWAIKCSLPRNGLRASIGRIRSSLPSSPVKR